MNTPARQENKKAAENYSPPPVSAAGTRLVTVSYQKTANDVWHDCAYLAARTITGRLVFGIVLLTFFAVPAACFFSVPPGSQAQREAAAILLPIFGVLYAVLVLCVLLGVYLAVSSMPKITITPEPECCGIIYLSSTQVPWRTFQRMAEEPEFFYFLGWKRMVFIPKRAFTSPAEAGHFFHIALTYWQDAAGTNPLPAP